jgi:hypothetical protein
MQEAARKVADENRKLRILLAQHGIMDDTVVASSQSSPASDTLTGAQFASSMDTVQPTDEFLQIYKPPSLEGHMAILPTSTSGGSGSLDSSQYTSTFNCRSYTHANPDTLWYHERIQTPNSHPMARDWMSYPITHSGLPGSDDNS